MTVSPLSSKLKALGVQIGAREAPPPKPPKQRRPHYTIEHVIAGRVITHGDGASCFVVETTYDLDHRHGEAALHAPLPLTRVAQWARDARIAGCTRESLVFLDTETTGLAGGTGTLPFMIGVGRFVADQFRVAQFFMRDPTEEAATLTALTEWLAPCAMLVTFNGKAFDVPLVQARYILQRRDWPLSEIAHLDLLMLARRLWRDRLASRALGALERDILGAVRTHDDVPGWLIPLMYLEYLKTGDARPLKGVFYHNAMDIVALAALLGYMTQLLENPLSDAVQHPIDYVSLGKIYEGMGEYELAAQAYERGMADRLPNNVFNNAMQRLAYLRRKQGHFEQTLELWREAAKRGELYAYIALAKHYEHHARDYAEAERLTCEALALAQSKKFSGRERQRYLTELEHRLERVRRKRLAVSSER
jgi:hypothetical protein